jgi:hypothetical protein
LVGRGRFELPTNGLKELKPLDFFINNQALAAHATCKRSYNVAN